MEPKKAAIVACRHGLVQRWMSALETIHLCFERKDTFVQAHELFQAQSPATRP